MSGRRRERLAYLLVALIAAAAVLVILYKAERIGWSTDSAAAPVQVVGF